MGKFNLLDIWSQADRYIVENANSIFIIGIIVVSPVLVTLITIGIGKLIMLNTAGKKIRKSKLKKQQKKSQKQQVKAQKQQVSNNFTTSKLDNLDEPLDKSQYSNLSMQFGLDGKQIK